MSTSGLLLQVIVILSTARAFGWLLKYLGQTSVIGEMTAGIVLGPLGFGVLFPEWQASLFGDSTLAGLTALSTLGLVLFMFVMGLELQAHQGVVAQVKSSSYVAGFSVLLPLGLGIAISPALYPSLAPAGVSFWPFALFLSTALSITAFPVMARILKDRDLCRTPFGQLALSSAAATDVVSWLLLAVVLTSFNSRGGYAVTLEMVGGLIGFVTFAYLGLRPFLARTLRGAARGGELSPAATGAVILGLLACAMLTERLHLHAVFGAFLFGTCFPHNDERIRSLAGRIESVSMVLLMPLFFALAGLGATASAFTASGAAALSLIFGVAVFGKIAGGAIGARLGGHGWRDSLATGALMNARGLMELIVIKIGLDAGVIGQELFTILLLMALMTTVMAGPLVTLFSARMSGPPRGAKPRPLAGSQP